MRLLILATCLLLVPQVNGQQHAYAPFSELGGTYSWSQNTGDDHKILLFTQVKYLLGEREIVFLLYGQKPHVVCREPYSVGDDTPPDAVGFVGGQAINFISVCSEDPTLGRVLGFTAQSQAGKEFIHKLFSRSSEMVAAKLGGYNFFINPDGYLKVISAMQKKAL